MKKIIILFFLLNMFLFGGLFDFLQNSKINKTYKNKKYSDTIAKLQALEKNAVVNYNLANSYYKLKEYKKALQYYKIAFGDGVDEHMRLHNIGNCYFKLKEYKNALIAYKEALKKENDKDTLYNLKLVLNRLKHHKIENKLKKEEKKKQKTKQQKKSKKKSKKLTKKELKKLKKQLEKEKLRKELKKQIKSSFKDRKVPVIMYIIKEPKQKRIKNPW